MCRPPSGPSNVHHTSGVCSSTRRSYLAGSGKPRRSNSGAGMAFSSAFRLGRERLVLQNHRRQSLALHETEIIRRRSLKQILGMTLASRWTPGHFSRAPAVFQGEGEQECKQPDDGGYCFTQYERKSSVTEWTTFWMSAP